MNYILIFIDILKLYTEKNGPETGDQTNIL